MIVVGGAVVRSAERGRDVHTELHTTVAQVLPVFLLAPMWESASLDRLRSEHRPGRGGAERGCCWTKPRVRFRRAMPAASCRVLRVCPVGATADGGPVVRLVTDTNFVGGVVS